MKRSLFLLYIQWIITAGWAQHLTDSILVRLNTYGAQVPLAPEHLRSARTHLNISE